MPRTILKFLAMLVLASVLTGAPAWGETLSFAQARELALAQHEGLKALAREIAAAEAAVRQAGAYPNPEVEIAAEDFGEAEVEVVLSQVLPIGGTRGAVVAVARCEEEIAHLRLESARISVEAELVRRFIPLLAARRRLSLLDSLLDVSARTTEEVQRLVDAGGAMALDLVRSELEADELRLERAEIMRSLAESRLRLSELWGERAFGFDGVEGSLARRVNLPPPGDISAAAETHPDLLLLEKRTRLIEAEMEEASAERWPELTLSGGYIRDNEMDEEAAIVGVSFPLPVFDRNSAAVTEKLHEMAASEHGAAADWLERAAAARELHSQISGTGRELAALSGDLLRRAAHIHEALEEYYVQGKTGILDVLEARSYLLDLRMRIIDLQEEQAQLAADLVELTGYRIQIIE